MKGEGVMQENGFKKALREGRLQIGFWQALGSATTAEISAQAGFDWLLIDGEHGLNTLTDIADQLRAVAPYGAHPVVRVPSGEPWIIKQVLDAGAMTVLVPLVNSAEEARAMADAMRYPPEGVRGFAGIVRAAGWGRDRDYLERANEAVCLLVQMESREAYEALDAIVTVEGVDGVFIGPWDFAASLGHPGDPMHPEVRRFIEDAILRIREAGKAAGILASDEKFARECIEIGANFVAVGTDVSTFVKAVDDLAECWKDHLKQG